MWGIIGIMFISMVIASFELPKLIKGKRKKEAVVFLSILLIATTLALLKIQDVIIPNPLTGIQALYRPIGTIIQKFLGQ